MKLFDHGMSANPVVSLIFSMQNITAFERHCQNKSYLGQLRVYLFIIKQKSQAAT